MGRVTLILRVTFLHHQGFSGSEQHKYLTEDIPQLVNMAIGQFIHEIGSPSVDHEIKYGCDHSDVCPIQHIAMSIMATVFSNGQHHMALTEKFLGVIEKEVGAYARNMPIPDLTLAGMINRNNRHNN